MRRRALLLAGLLPGCTLIDQRTFDANAARPPERPKPPVPPAPVPVEPGPAPLLVIRLPVTGSVRDDVSRAVVAARRRKPGVVFDVVEITGDAGVSMGAEAAEVAEMITAQGVPAARVHLLARPVPNASREVRVYVR